MHMPPQEQKPSTAPLKPQSDGPGYSDTSSLLFRRCLRPGTYHHDWSALDGMSFGCATTESMTPSSMAIFLLEERGLRRATHPYSTLLT